MDKTELLSSLPSGGDPFTVHDLDATPDDGRRYELVDGVLPVSPVPSFRHQIVVKQLVVKQLAVLLHALSPPGVEVCT